ncbi:MAG: thrombospondin type 3 repeat-containing protein [Kofleriaceae bacterium]
MWQPIATGVLAGLVGCFSPAAPSGAPCAAPGLVERCPSGQICVAHDGVETCETTDDGDDDVDTDGDTIVDRLDNCPALANANQANEDQDALGDVCDPCPPFDGNADADDDGVGDACDPNPEVPGDRLIAFEGFAQPLPSTWTIAGTFIVGGGEGLALSRDNASTIVSFASPATPRVEIRATATVLTINAAGSNLAAVSLVERMAPGTDTSIACQLSGLADGMQQQLRIFDLTAGNVIDSAPHVFRPAVEIDLRLRRAATTYRCRATSPALELAGTAAFSPMAPRIGLRVRGADATFHWVLVVSSP